MPKTHLKGEVPDDVFNAELLEYLKRIEANPDAKRVPSQFEYNNNKYYFERSQGTESGFRVRRSADFVAKEQRRRENLNKPKLSEAERMMVQNYYDEAARRGLHVDHKYPAKHGGMHHPSNLGLMQPKENLRKGDAVGGNYRYEPLIQEGGSIRFRRGVATSLAAGGVAALGPLGTAASAAETTERVRIADETGDVLDRVQAGISGFSLAADGLSYVPVATIPATFASTAADALNVGIDTLRGMITFKSNR